MPKILINSLKTCHLSVADSPDDNSDFAPYLKEKDLIMELDYLTLKLILLLCSTSNGQLMPFQLQTTVPTTTVGKSMLTVTRMGAHKDLKYVFQA